MSEDFSKAKRRSMIPPDPNKLRITIRLDGDIISHFKRKVLEAGGGNYQSSINQALREFIEADSKLLEERLRKVIREELRQVSEPR
ncbi:MAG: BrnA antitoxin family protein [Candidatus Berkelbacteria bacterium]|nr:BrnA antitoxin family protein [Candidatus Berkelbacteria bacterium]